MEPFASNLTLAPLTPYWPLGHHPPSLPSLLDLAQSPPVSWILPPPSVEPPPISVVPVCYFMHKHVYVLLLTKQLPPTIRSLEHSTSFTHMASLPFHGQSSRRNSLSVVNSDPGSTCSCMPWPSSFISLCLSFHKLVSTKTRPIYMLSTRDPLQT